MLWIVGFVVVVLLFRFAWKTYTHRAHVLARQGANMNWVAIGSVVDAKGYRNVRLRRGETEAVIWFIAENVTLIKPSRPEPFNDFIEIERWLAAREGSVPSTVTEEEYFMAVTAWLKSVGHYEAVLHSQANDKAFFVESMKLCQLGWRAGRDVPLMGAFMAEAATAYATNPEVGLAFTRALQGQIAELKP